MPTGLKRFQLTGDLHFITFSCHRRKPFLAEPEAYATVEQALEDTRKHDGFFVAGYVLMPEHLHMLLSEPPGVVLAAALKRLKWSTSRKLKGTYRDHFWQPPYHDFNVYSQYKVEEKLDYMHRNPVKRSLAEKPEDWPWSSARHHQSGHTSTIEVESWWTE